MPHTRTDGTVASAPVDPVAVDHDLRTLVTVSRAHPRDVGQRQVIVQLDDGPKVTLRYGQSFTKEIDPGTHRLRANNTFVWKRVPFTVEPGEHLEFVLINRCGPIWVSIAAIFGAAPMFLTIHRRSLV